MGLAVMDISDFKLTHVGNEEFLRAVFGDRDWGRAHVCAFTEDPTELDRLGLRHYWAGGPASRLLSGFLPTQNQYFTISLFEPDPVSGRQRRKKSLHEATYCVVLDDVGDPQGTTAKVPWERVLMRPSWVLETSPGNYQVGYILDAPEVRSGKVSALLDALVASGLVSGNKDPGMKGVTRYVRLPEGTNTKRVYGGLGFPHRMVWWEPSTTVNLEGLADAYGVRKEVDEAPDKLTAWQHAAVPEGEDQILDTIIRAGWFRQKIDVNRWAIECPWIDEHTGRADSGAAYLGGGKFKCHHGHCAERTSDEFMEKLLADHGTEWKEAQREAVVREFGDIGGPSDPFEGVREGVSDQVSRMARVAMQGKFAGSFSLGDVQRGQPILDQNWVLKGLIPEEGVGVLYGAPKTGKTFVMLDMAYRVGAGMDWHGHVVKKPGLVVYVAAEGGYAGAWNRSRAWVERWGTAPENVLVWPGTVRMGMNVEEDARLLVGYAREQAGALGVEPALIVLDTLNRTMVGDENSAQEMAAYLNVVESVRRELGCFVMIVHHSGKDKTRGARGSSAAQGFVDVEIEVDRDKSGGLGTPGEIHVANSRSGADGQKYGFVLELVKLGIDRDLEEVKVPIAVPCAAPAAVVRLSGVRQKKVYQFLAVDMDGQPTAEDYIVKEMKVQHGLKDTREILAALDEKGVVSRIGEYWAVEKDVEVVA